MKVIQNPLLLLEAYPGTIAAQSTFLELVCLSDRYLISPAKRATILRAFDRGCDFSAFFGDSAAAATSSASLAREMPAALAAKCGDPLYNRKIAPYDLGGYCDVGVLLDVYLCELHSIADRRIIWLFALRMFEQRDNVVLGLLTRESFFEAIGHLLAEP